MLQTHISPDKNTWPALMQRATDDDTVIVSARSIGSANVQVILEALGGGGNAATAGAQIKNSTVKDVLDDLVASIDSFYEK